MTQFGTFEFTVMPFGLARPKGMTVNSKAPNWVTKAVCATSSDAMQIRWVPSDVAKMQTDIDNNVNCGSLP
jgi:hypothetical protein